MEWIKQAFSAAQMANNTLVVNDLAPDEIVLYRVKQALEGDDKLQTVFGGRIEAVTVLDPYDFRTMPRLRIGLFSRLPEEAPTQLVIDDVSVLIEIRYEMTLVRSPEDGEPGMATLIRHIASILRNPDHRLLPMIVEGQKVGLAMESRMAGVFFRPDFNPETGNIAYTQTVEWQYRVDVDRDTMKIRNVLAAGG